MFWNDEFLKRFVQTDDTVLITGPTGVGKTHLAKKLYNLKKFDGPFLSCNIPTLSETVIESELFGHKRGSFTGAIQDRKGHLEECGRGIIFFDEIGDVSLSTQKKLLRVIEEREFTPVGETRSRKFTGKMVFATNVCLKEKVKEGLFREDLYYRISLLPLDVPPIRTDGRLLKTLLSGIFYEEKMAVDKEYLCLSDEVKRFLLFYDWPGNIREIKNVMRFFSLMAKGPVVRMEDLPGYLFGKSAEACHMEESFTRYFLENFASFQEAKEAFERSYILARLTHNFGKINKTSRVTGMNKVTLLSKIRKYEIDVKAVRDCI